MNIADKIFETVKGLSETDACQVLDLAEKLKAKEQGDFFSAAGIWAGRDVTEESLRALAWRDSQR